MDTAIGCHFESRHRKTNTAWSLLKWKLKIKKQIEIKMKNKKKMLLVSR